MGKSASCPFHGMPLTTWCPDCVEIVEELPQGLTREERATELEAWVGPLTVPFDRLHRLMEHLVGRPVWTHEFVRPEHLVAEIMAGGLEGDPAEHSRRALRDLVPEEKIIVVDASDE